jgi:hypothetical protein
VEFELTPVDEFQQLSILQAPRIKRSVTMMLDDHSLAYAKGFLMLIQVGAFALLKHQMNLSIGSIPAHRKGRA